MLCCHCCRYHHESREELARKGAAVHEEIFPHREGSA